MQSNVHMFVCLQKQKVAYSSFLSGQASVLPTQSVQRIYIHSMRLCSTCRWTGQSATWFHTTQWSGNPVNEYTMIWNALQTQVPAFEVFIGQSSESMIFQRSIIQKRYSQRIFIAIKGNKFKSQRPEANKHNDLNM